MPKHPTPFAPPTPITLPPPGGDQEECIETAVLEPDGAVVAEIRTKSRFSIVPTEGPSLRYDVCLQTRRIGHLDHEASTWVAGHRVYRVTPVEWSADAHPPRLVIAIAGVPMDA